MYDMNIQNDVIGLVLRENCKSKQVTDFIAWPSRCHDTMLLADMRNFLVLTESRQRSAVGKDQYSERLNSPKYGKSESLL
jgi:hypothetical protein